MFAEACVVCVSIMNQSGESCQKETYFIFSDITQAANLMIIIISYQTLTTHFTHQADSKNIIIPDSHSSFSSVLVSTTLSSAVNHVSPGMYGINIKTKLIRK